MTDRASRIALTLTLALLLGAGACSDDGTGPEDSVVGGVDLALLFDAPTQAELDAVSADWAGRSTDTAGVLIEMDTVFTPGGVSFPVRVRVVSHLVDGFRHVGAVVTADGLSESAPVLIYSHAGDEGVSVEELFFQFPLVGADAARFVWVVPSFRSEPLRFAEQTYTSQGTPSPWDGDVDDALGLFEVALAIEPLADADNVGVLGFSRGSGVALLMGVRDERIDRIVEFFGPTDFFDDWVREQFATALRGEESTLPGAAFLEEEFVGPLSRNEKTIAEVRLELVRRSPALYASDLPFVQLHHGTADDVVPVSQAQSLIDAMSSLGRAEPEFEPYLYEGAGHNPLAMVGSISLAAGYLRDLLPAIVVQ